MICVVTLVLGYPLSPGGPMKILVLLTLILSFNSVAFAQRQNPFCSEFTYIQNKMKAINATSVDRAIPYADWVDERYRREDQRTVMKNTAKVVILALIGRLSFVTFWMMPNRAEAATVTGSYIRNPESYSRFLQLTPQRGCQVLGIPGREGDILREITHEVYLELRRASR